MSKQENCDSGKFSNDTLEIIKLQKQDTLTAKTQTPQTSAYVPINKKKINDDINTYYNAPGWYLKNRIQIHTRLYLSDLNSKSFFEFPKQLSKRGVTVLTRQIKSADEAPWWPSSVGTINSLAAPYNKNGTNLAKSIINQLHSSGIKAIIYYRHMEDAQMEAAHSDWIVKDVNGSAIQSKRGMYLCLNSPYRNVVITRLSELSAFGADGFYFDEMHIPLKGCFCKYCQEEYKKEFGKDLKKDYLSGNKLDFFKFKNGIIERFFNDVKKGLAKSADSTVLLVSGNSWPTFTDLHMNSEIFSRFILKSEAAIPSQALVKKGTFTMPKSLSNNLSMFYWNAFSYSNMRDNSAGPPHIWCPRLRNSAEVANTAATLLSFGCVANLDIPADSKDISMFYDAIQWNKKFGEYFQKLTPYSYAGVLVSENQRNKFIQNSEKAWSDVLIPAYKSFQKLYQAGVPVQILSDASYNTPKSSSLNVIYCNKELTKPSNSTISSKLKDNDVLNSLSGKKLAIELGSPIFSVKENERFHLNYFKDDNGYIYVITSTNFTENLRVKNSRVKQHVERAKQLQVRAGDIRRASISLYIKKSFIGDNAIENIMQAGQSIKPVSVDGDYLVFNLSINANELGFYRFSAL